MSRVLVTGCAGYIGSVLCNQLLAEGYYVTGIDNLMYNNGHAVFHLLGNKNFHFVKGDVRDKSLMEEAPSVADIFIPLAGIVGAPACSKDITLAEEVNDYAIYDLVSRLSHRKRIIYPNTNSGYGINSSGECTEDSPTNPISVYGKSKKKGENYVLRQGNGVSLRLATVCGASPRMRFDLLVNDFVSKLYYEKEITIYEPSFMRNYVHIRDVVDAFMFMIETNHVGIFNLGNPDANLSKFDLAVKVAKKLGYDPNKVIKIGQGEDPDKRNYVISNKKILNTGFVFQHSIDDAIEECKSICKIRSYDEIKRMNNL